MTIYTEVQGGRFIARTLVAITVRGTTLQDKWAGLKAWKASTPGLTYFVIKAGV